MGQGLYNMLGYGCLNPPAIEDEDGYVDLPDEIRDLGLRDQYETKDEYLVIPLAVDDGFLQDEMSVPALPDRILRCPPRRARYFDSAVVFSVPQIVKENWAKAQAEYKARGLSLPDGRLVVINDWD